MIDTVLRVVLSLATVLGLMWVVARFMPGRVRVRNNALLTVVARQPLGRNASLSVVTVGERVLVLGVTDQKVSLVTEMLADELPSTSEGTQPTRPEATVVDCPAVASLPVPVNDATPTPAPALAMASGATPAPALAVASGASEPSGATDEKNFAALLQGSILSPHTWKQAVAATKGPAPAGRHARGTS